MIQDKAENRTGFHVFESKPPENGSEKEVDDLYLSIKTAVQIVLSKDNLVLYTERYLNRSKLALVGSLFVTFTGLLGVVGFIKKYLEMYLTREQKKRIEKLSMEIILLSRYNLEQCFKNLN